MSKTKDEPLVDRKELVSQFKAAGLKLKLLEDPIQGGNANRAIIQFDIRSKRKGNVVEEEFILYPGADDNNITVVSGDKKAQQLVLRMQEAKRDFVVRVPKSRLSDRDRQNIIKEYADGTVDVKQTTSPNSRQMLVGMDETHLFAAGLTGSIKNVKDAKAALKPAAANPNDPRQGEWIFIKPSKDELAAVEDAIKRTKTAVQRKVAIGDVFPGRRSLNPHVADEIVTVVTERPKVVGGDSATNIAAPVVNVYIRGAVRHIQHKTKKFANWMRVVPNREFIERARRDGLMTWRD